MPEAVVDTPPVVVPEAVVDAAPVVVPAGVVDAAPVVVPETVVDTPALVDAVVLGCVEDTEFDVVDWVVAPLDVVVD